MRKAKVFFSDSPEMCYTHLSRVFCRLNMPPVSRFQNFLCPGSDDGRSSNNSGRWNVSKVYCQYIVESTEVEMHLSTCIKLSKKNFRGILSIKSVRRRTLVIGLIYGPRANKQFDIVL